MPRTKRRKLNSEDNSKAKDPIHIFPEDIWDNILSFVYNKTDLSSLSQVCKKFADLTIWKRRLLYHLTKQGLDFIQSANIFANLEGLDVKKLFLSIAELDRSLTMNNDQVTYFRSVSQESLDFLHQKRSINAVAGYYYCCYATTLRNTTQGKVKIEQKEINELLNNIAEKNPAVYFLLAAHRIHPSIPSENRFENFKKGLEKLGVTLTPENWDILQKKVAVWTHINKYLFRPLQFFLKKSELRYADEELNKILADKSNKAGIIVNTLLNDGWTNAHGELQTIEAFTHKIYNANITVLEFLQGKFHYQVATLRLLSHPLLGDKLIQKLKLFQLQTKKENPETAMFKLLDEINENSEGLLTLFDKHPNLIDKYTLNQIAKMNNAKIENTMQQLDPEYKKPLNIWDPGFQSSISPTLNAEEITQEYINNIGGGLFPIPPDPNQFTDLDLTNLDDVFKMR